MKITITLFALLFSQLCFCQQADTSKVNMDIVDSLIENTPGVDLCMKDGKEDMRFFNKTPEKYCDFKQKFIDQALATLTIPTNSRFVCDITAEVNCEGKAGNYTFAFEPRTFTMPDFEILSQYIAFVNSLRDFNFTPAVYLGEKVNSKVRFKLLARDGKITMQ